MKIIADLHLHSKYSRAVSKEMTLAIMAEWGEKKGIDLLATADWTHPLWYEEIKANLEEDSQGIFKVKGSKSKTRYILSTEISNIYSKGDKGRRIHTVFLAPSLEAVEKINKEIKARGGNLMSDGRPILGFTMEEMCELVWGVDEKVIVLPAHIWTPWFSMFGSKSGFDSVKECFGKYADRIYAIETGLSSDPLMNWKVKDLDKRAITSSSDAHSPAKLGREATVFTTEKDKYSFEDVRQALKERWSGENKGKLKLSYTIEFHPEEGKYHYSGHRKCGVVQDPAETKEKGKVCHVCGKPLTLGVMHRINQLGEKDREEMKAVEKENDQGVRGYFHPTDKTRPPYVMLVPLQEILSEALDCGVNTKTVQGAYEKMIDRFGGEFKILLETDIKEIKKMMGEKVAEAMVKMRKGEIEVKPGFDGEFGVVSIFKKEGEEDKQDKVEQESLF